MSDESKKPLSVAGALRLAGEKLKASGISQASREAKSLLAFALNKNQIFLIAHSEYELAVEEKSRFQDCVKRRAEREPYQYIVGRQEFYGLDFAVTKDVLIPRPETEMIVEAAIEFLQNKDQPIFCEVGIGSGCIAVSILHFVKTASAVGLDISEKALDVAGRNAKTHQLTERLELKISDVYDNLKSKTVDLIVSNPPYIPGADIENLQSEVRDYEPLTALNGGGGDGLSIIEKIIADAPRFLKPHGVLLLEIGINQAEAVKKMFNKKIWLGINVTPDLQNIPRMVKAVRK